VIERRNGGLRRRQGRWRKPGDAPVEGQTEIVGKGVAVGFQAAQELNGDD